MKSNDRLIAIAIGSILVVGAFLVGILISLPDNGDSSVRAQESTTPTPLPPPTAADLDRWEREWQESSGAGIQTIEVTAELIIKPGTENLYFGSGPGDREVLFRDSTSKTLPDGVALVKRSNGGICEVGVVCGRPPLYKLQKGEATAWVDSDGTVMPERADSDDHSAFPFLFED